LGFPLYRLILMQLLMTNMTALAVATLYYLWRAHHQMQLQRRRVLCQRVAFLLWTVAGQIQNSDSGLSATCRG
jgi:formate-dependent nitrite reductase membrane component NrfD